MFATKQSALKSQVAAVSVPLYCEKVGAEMMIEVTYMVLAGYSQIDDRARY